MKPVQRIIGFLGYVALRVYEDRLTQVASSLTYTTLLSVVPLITIAMATITSFPAFSFLSTEFKIFLLTNMVPEVAGKVITVYMEQFAEAAGRLTAVGIAFLAVTAMMLMFTIDNALNAIWHVTRPRSLLQRILIYWAVLTVGPALLGASLSLTSWLVSGSLGLTQEVPEVGMVLLKVVPVVLSTLAFSLLFTTVPNRYVPLRHALAGGLVAALAFEAMKRGFGFYITQFPTHRLIYGAFASIPIFLIWIYLSWLVILLGAVIAASLSSWRGPQSARMSVPGELFERALAVLKALFESLRTGEVVTMPLLARRSHASFDEIEDILIRLARAHWVRKAEGEGWVLVRDPEQIRVADVYRLFVFQREVADAADRDERLEVLLEDLDGKVSAELGMSIKQLFTGPRAVEIKRTG